MNGVHDLGGMHGFGPIVREENEPYFHQSWERRVFSMALSTLAARCFNVDEFRRTIERMPPAQYLSSSYYERWLHSVEALLVEKGFVTRDEIDVAMREPNLHGTQGAAPITSTRSVQRDAEKPRRPRFRVGQRVMAKNINPAGHTRLPRYARGKHGVVRHDWGVFVLPDSHAHGTGLNLQHCYGVEFSARELWGRDHPTRERIYLDLWEDYLEPDRDQPAKVTRITAKADVGSSKGKNRLKLTRKPRSKQGKTR